VIFKCEQIPLCIHVTGGTSGGQETEEEWHKGAKHMYNIKWVRDGKQLGAGQTTVLLWVPRNTTTASAEKSSDSNSIWSPTLYAGPNMCTKPLHALFLSHKIVEVGNWLPQQAAIGLIDQRQFTSKAVSFLQMVIRDQSPWQIPGFLP